MNESANLPKHQTNGIIGDMENNSESSSSRLEVQYHQHNLDF